MEETQEKSFLESSTDTEDGAMFKLRQEMQSLEKKEKEVLLAEGKAESRKKQRQ